MFTQRRILIVATSDDFVERFLLPHIKYLEDYENTVECACNETGFWFNEMKDNGINLHKIEFPRNPLSAKLFKSRNQLYKLVKKNKYDLIICHQPVGGVMGRMVGHKFHIPVIYVAHGFHFYKGCPKKNLLYKYIEKHYSKYTDALVTMNEEDYQSALTFKAKKVYKINGIGVDINKYKKLPVSDALRKELNIDPKNFVLLSVGELNDNKNHEVVIRAIAKLKDTNIKYLICGQGKRYDEYLALTKQLGIEEQVQLLGFRKDISEIMSLSNLYVMPSFREGLPKSVMEAMCAELPVIASNIRGCKDLIDEPDGGILCTPSSIDEFANAIKEIKEHVAKQASMAKYNIQKVKQFSIDEVIKQMKNVYEETEIK